MNSRSSISKRKSPRGKSGSVRHLLLTGALAAGVSVAGFGIYRTALGEGPQSSPGFKFDDNGVVERYIKEDPNAGTMQFSTPLTFLTLGAEGQPASDSKAAAWLSTTRQALSPASIPLESAASESLQDLPPVPTLPPFSQRASSMPLPKSIVPAMQSKPQDGNATADLSNSVIEQQVVRETSPASTAPSFDGGMFQFDAAPQLHSPKQLTPKPMDAPSYVMQQPPAPRPSNIVAQSPQTPAGKTQQSPVKTADSFVEESNPTVMAYAARQIADTPAAATPIAVPDATASELGSSSVVGSSSDIVNLPAGQTPSQFIQQQQNQARAQMQQAQLHSGQGGPAYDGSEGYVEGLGADCGLGCPSSWYVQGEAVFLLNDGSEHATYSHQFNSAHFGYELGGRLTVGYRCDCLDGYEISFTGPFKWGRSTSLTGTGLSSSIQPAPGTPFSNTAFTNANFQSQSYTAEYNSLEAHQKWWGWDVLSCQFGFRYVKYDEDFDFVSISPQGGGAHLGTFSNDTVNNLIGPQLGLNLYHPLGPWSMSASVKGALYANFASGTTNWINNGTINLATSDDKIDWAASVDVGYYLSRRLGSNVQLRVGYEFSYFYQVALASDQIRGPITSGTGRNIDNEGDQIFHGAVAGAEIAW